MKKLMITLACAAFCFAQQSFGKTYYWNWAGTVANTATNQYNWTDAANWTDSNGAAVETCPGAGDTADFGKSFTATARWVRIPADGITVTRINVPSKSSKEFTLNFTGGPITFDTAKDDYSYNSGEITASTHVWFYNDLKFKNQRVKFSGTAVVAGRMDIPATYYVVHAIWQRLDFQATSTETDIVNPWPTNVSYSTGSTDGGLSTFAPYYMTADKTVAGCILKKDSPFVTGSKLSARSGDYAQLPVGTLVTCSDSEALQPGTFLKAIYAANIIELSQPPLKDLEDASLTFSAFKPKLRYEIHHDGAPRVGCFNERYSTDQDYQQILLGGIGPSGCRFHVQNKTCARIIVRPTASATCGDINMLECNGVRYFEFPTNQFGMAGFSTNNVPLLYFSHNGWASCGLHLTVPEEVETQPMRIADFNRSTGTAVTKVGPGTVYLRVDKRNDATCTVNNPVNVNVGGLRLGTTAAVNNALEKGATVKSLTVAKGTSFIADDNAKLSITVTSFSEAKRLEVGTNAWVKMVYGKDYTATNFTMGAGSTLTLAAATGTAVKKVTAVKDFTIGGSSEANAVSTLDAGLTVSEGMSLALSAARPIPGSVAVTGTVTLPKQGVLKVSGVTSATPPGTYEILTPGTLTLTGDGDFNWTCESDSPRRIFKLRLVDNKLLLDVLPQGLIMMVM